MLKTGDINAFSIYRKIFQPQQSETINNEAAVTEKTQIGTLYAEFHVQRYDDIKSNGKFNDSSEEYSTYLITCSQKINIIGNYDGGAGLKKEMSYQNYPIIIGPEIKVVGSDRVSVELLGFAPKTINTSVNTSGTVGDSTGATTARSRSNTTGTTHTDTHSFDVSVTMGVQGSPDGILPSASTTDSYGHSWSTGHDHSTTSGNSQSVDRSRNAADSSSMSIKDWGAYAIVPTDAAMAWEFVQEFPWNAYVCRQSEETKNSECKGGKKGNPIANHKNPLQTKVVLPSEVANRLYDGTFLYPPSHLAEFGVSFNTNVRWLVRVPKGCDQNIAVVQNINYYAGSHCLECVDSKSLPAVYAQKIPTQLWLDESNTLSTNLQLDVMALHALGHPNKSAIIGFSPTKFLQKPVPASGDQLPIPFRCSSGFENILLNDITDYKSLGHATELPAVGFSLKNQLMTANFNDKCKTLSCRGNFKVIDEIHNYTLHMKHWLTRLNSSGNDKPGFRIDLEFSVNGQSVLNKSVEAGEGQGGEDNLLSISLRNLDFISADFHDFLRLGLNQIDVKITIDPEENAPISDCAYQIRAFSIESD
ncbi:hypothetical protein [Pseudophaeobacter sp.]|uniref:hypothetical protein n=1 Tax=Pseudophaeobacter sp. TaxID=1971739 RepID=UPI003297A92E